MLFALIQIIDYLVGLLVIFIIVQFVLSLLITFNVVNLHNQFVAAIWTAVNAILDPILNPIRKLIPAMGGIDFSPMVLIIGLNVFQMLLSGIASDMVRYG